jgi:autonomous glycyl radical cofactor GrcA
MNRGLVVAAVAILTATGALAIPHAATAQDPVGRLNPMRGEMVSAAYEGWWPNEDGTYQIFFGYFNSNWEQEFDIPVGVENYFTMAEAGQLDDLEFEAYDPSQADQGQPTHIYPRRSPFLFTITVPADFGDKEWVWTLKTPGKVSRAHGILAPDYRIDPQVISTEVGGAFGSLDNRLRENLAPEMEIEGGEHRTVRVGQPLTLVSHAEDPDNYPPRSNRRLPQSTEQLYRPATAVTVSCAPGLRMHWGVYRGPADNVSFDPIQLKTWMDSRVYANSSCSPPFVLPEVPGDNTWRVRATFDEPGEYTLLAVGSDGSMTNYQYIDVTVTR